MYSCPKYSVAKIGMKYVVMPSWYSGRAVADLDNFYWSYFKSRANHACDAINSAAGHAWRAARMLEWSKESSKSV